MYRVAFLFHLLLLSSMANAQGLTPAESLQRMKPADGLKVQLVAAEPLIRQPVTMTFDTQGRLWVIQYLQYPTPAGLKPVDVDQYLRTRYDRVPEPPPHGPRGVDRVTILFDPDKQGRFQQAKDFVTGLNLASGLALGNEGAYVFQAPYLLFYPDRNKDDIPDGNPEILLKGFGLEDAHAVGNSLTFGPDGWLYGAQGSTVTARIADPLTGKVLEFQQGIWRYHPRTRQFELFAEGGGNTWGLDFDRNGQLIAGTNWSNVAALHMVQGGYYVKGFSKHGPLHHPHAYGYFEHMPCEGFRGGHVTCGGIVYQGNLLPDRFKNTYLGCNLLDHNLYWYSFQRKGSTFTMKHEGTLLQGNDPWFRPIDLLTGPDGAVYVCDWHDKRANHVDPVDNWDKSNGRIYKLIPAQDSETNLALVDLTKASVSQLIALLDHPNSWQRSEARRLLNEKQNPEIRDLLKNTFARNPKDFSLDLLWTLYGCQVLDEPLAQQLLNNPREEVRSWIIRMITDHATPKGIQHWVAVLSSLVTLAEVETSPVVLSQLASSARRLVRANSDKRLVTQLLRSLLNNKHWKNDAHGQLLLWWAVEELLSRSNLEFDLSLLVDDEGKSINIDLKGFLMERLSRRLMSAESQAGYKSQARLLEYCSARTVPSIWLSSVLTGMESELAVRPLKNMPPELIKVLESLPTESSVQRIRLLTGDTTAIQWAHEKLNHQPADESYNTKLLECLLRQSHILPSLDLQKLFTSAKTDLYRTTLLEALTSKPDTDNIKFIIGQYTQCSSSLRRKIIGLLVSRPASSISLCEAVEQQKIASKDIQLDQVQQMRRYQNATVDRVIGKHWGNVKTTTSGEKQARIRSIVHMLNQGQGKTDIGKALFTQHCATCHQLFGEGGKVGPDLTGTDRTNRDFLATHIVDPNLVIRPEYAAYTVITADGRTLTGLITEETTQGIKLLDAQANTVQLARDRIESLSASRQSLMPESILDPLDDQQIRHLFAYLQQPDTKPTQKPVHELLNSTPLQPPPAFDFADKMVTGIDRMLDRLTRESVARRAPLWKLDISSLETLLKSVEPNRQRLKSILGVVEERPQKSNSDYPVWPTVSLLLGQNEYYQVFIVRWRAFGNVEAEGLLLLPTDSCVADVIVLPDADQSPEQLVGLVPGLPQHQQTARILAEQGCRVLIPVIIDRADTYSGIPGIRMTNQPHREWIYRQAYEMGRHIIGYEILKVQAGIDWLQSTQTASRPIGLTGYAEGGLIALHSGAIDTRIKVTSVDGYFGVRENLWQEPIYRNVWRQLTEFGDAEIAQLYPPRQLIVGSHNPPRIIGPPASRSGRSGAAPGKLETTHYKTEWRRLEPFRLKFPTAIQLDEQLETESLHSRFFQALTGQPFQARKTQAITLSAILPDSAERMKRQVESLSNHIQDLRRKSEAYRDKHFWAKLNNSSLDKYQASVAPFRQQFEHAVIGKIDLPLSAHKARTRLINEQPGYVTYEVEIDVIAPDLIAYGWLLVPRNMKPGERSPVVVCQHGLEGRPADLADPKIDHPAYHRYACRLAERGFIVFAPQNPYLFGDRFRLLQRKANPLGLSLFSFIVAQHRQITEWLATLSMVDPDRIGFYGLSYGGKTAMRVPALVPRYCLSICSADFNEWIWKNTSIDNRYTYMTTNEWEMVEWNLGHTFNYAEMAALIAPRPFMVERGHRDGVAPDEQVAYEYAKVRRHYADLKIPDRTAIQFFDGPHSIHGQGTFQFLHRHMK